ncbi:TDT family transporter [Solibacillus sp. R5-41]|uniref:TDT family transporter n=1 Tax=Solibacillus sp. R5-41 TaxID=2048654 RepID=UPI0020A2BC38|nr:TDT family transporter [Solibacillus sp. R5-41]
MEFLSKLPIATGGLMLALVSLSKLYSVMEMTVMSVLFFLCGLPLFILLFAKIIFAFRSVVQDMQNPIIASISPTIPMGTMVLASIMENYSILAPIASTIWYVAVVMQLMIVGYFSYRFIWKKTLALQDVYPSWFIIFVGLGIIPNTTGDQIPQFAQWIFWIVLINYLILLPMIIVRLFKHELGEPAKPLFTLLAAPGSICLAGYLNLFDTYVNGLVFILLIISQAMYIVVLVQLPKLLQLPFYPSFAAFTFPLVISATALVTTARAMAIPSFNWLAGIEIVIASCVVVYVFVRYNIYFIRLRTD